jgi:hypothetical protein
MEAQISSKHEYVCSRLHGVTYLTDVIASFEATFFWRPSLHFPQFISKAKVDTHKQQSAYVMAGRTDGRTDSRHEMADTQSHAETLGSQKKLPVSTDMEVNETRYVRGWADKSLAL